MSQPARRELICPRPAALGRHVPSLTNRSLASAEAPPLRALPPARSCHGVRPRPRSGSSALRSGASALAFSGSPAPPRVILGQPAGAYPQAAAARSLPVTACPKPNTVTRGGIPTATIAHSTVIRGGRPRHPSARPRGRRQASAALDSDRQWRRVRLGAIMQA